MTNLAQVIEVLEAAYPPATAESWDRVGLVCGDPEQQVRTALVAVDATDAVVDRAVAEGVDLLLVHHPPLLRGVHSVAADTPKGRLLHRLIRAGCALYAAHTNADVARPGVNDALTDALGLDRGRSLVPSGDGTLDRWVVTVPIGHVDEVREAVFAAGAGRMGGYSRCSFAVDGRGSFLPGEGTAPAIGDVGAQEELTETRLEFVAPPAERERVRRALLAAHPYEVPAHDILVSHAAPPAGTRDPGLGRVCTLATPTTLAGFTELVAECLPRTVWGVRAAGDPDRPVRTVAVCGGAGDSVLGAARRVGADVFLTGDLRHHVVDEFLREGGPALVDAAHWALEFPWCAVAAELLVVRTGIEARVCELRTDPWTVSAGAGDGRG